MKKMIKKVGFLMDSPENLHPEKDSSIVLIEEALRRNYEVYYFQQKDLWMQNGDIFAKLKKLKNWFDVENEMTVSVNKLDILFMRKDPPVDMEYIYTTLLLDRAEYEGVKIINKPHALRAFNEKLFISWFSQCCVPTLAARNPAHLRMFYNKHKDVVFKPLNGMGGMGVFRAAKNDPNVSVIIETLTQNGAVYAMAQKYIPDVKNGDKRVILMNGKPLPYAISRIAQKGETRANLARGGEYIKASLTDRDRWICAQVGDVLKEKGILFAGLDIIGSYLTEINITSPTCLREIDQSFGINSACYLFDEL